MKRLIFSLVILLVIFGVQGCSEQALSTTVYTTNSEQVGTEENTEETTLSLFNLMVSFNSNGGSPVDSVLITDVNYQGEFPVPERSGYSFLGWYIDINQFPFDYDFSLLTDTSVTLQAKWEKNQYLLTIMDGELNLHQESVYYDTSINEILNSFQDKEGHSFEGWYLDFGNEQIAELTYMPANDVILYGKWDRNAYRLRYIDYDGTTLYDEQVLFQTSLVDIVVDEPTKIGHTFNGWHIQVPEEMPANDLLIQAMYRRNSYMISFETNGATQIEPITLPYEFGFSIADQYLVGYTFSGWFLDEDFVNELTEYIVPANDITLYAKWEKHSYQISLDTQGGNLLEPVNVLYLDPIELPIPTRDNYIFAGWYWDYGYENEFDWQTMNADNINLVAKWTTPEYHVNYYLLGGTNHEDNPLIVDGSEEILLNDPVMEGFTFVGWYLNQHFSGDPVTSIEQGITTDIELHAKWQMNQYDLTYVMLENPIGDDYGILHPGELVEDVANSEGIYTLLLTSDHRIFEYERHTIGPSVTTQYPVDMTSYFDLLEGEYITNIYAGDSHGAVLTSHKRLFMWGSNEYGQMALPVGTYSYGSEIPVDITDQFSLFPTEEIDLVALGARHTIVTTTHGRIFTFGLNNNGQLGVENNNYFANREPIEITLAFNLDAVKFEHFKYIYANRNHSMVITSENRVFVFGENDYGALGTGVEATVYEAPYEITNRFAFSLNEDIKIAKIAGSSGILITSENRIFTWGDNSSGQLGLSLNYQTFTPVPITEVIGAITLEEDEIIVDASTGYVTMVLTSKGKLFITGSRELLIGTNRPDNSRSTFAEYTSLINLEENELITRVYNSHNIAASIITSKGNILSWGQTHRLGMGDHPEWQINLPSPINLVHIVPFNVATYYYTEAIESYNYEISGYQFLGWYVDSLLEIPFDITNMPAEDLIVYGYYQEIPS